MVLAGVPLWWLMDSGALVVSTRAKLARGTCAPLLLVNSSCDSISGPFKYAGPNSITTRYWLSGL